ncbi:hypothetical protein BY996DRAFT_6464461 [Phakopsora pachyrhizi]|nr:hypothetical protein BY996DRAFT_6464461 [Phakopsora pachyrhizi]
MSAGVGGLEYVGSKVVVVDTHDMTITISFYGLERILLGTGKSRMRARSQSKWASSELKIKRRVLKSQNRNKKEAEVGKSRDFNNKPANKPREKGKTGRPELMEERMENQQKVKG